LTETDPAYKSVRIPVAFIEIQKCIYCIPGHQAESVEKVVQIARALGRDIATPAEARKILGIKVTSLK
jgi:hypothetical protein